MRRAILKTYTLPAVVLILQLATAVHLPALAQAQRPPNWQLPKAMVRAQVKITSSPDHPELGVFVKIPDGGLLPGRFPVPEVRSSSGALVESIIVGHDPNDSLGVLFAEPPDGNSVTIYITGSASAPTAPETRLFPSVIYYTRNGGATLDKAKKLSRTYPPAQGASFDQWSCIGSMVNPFGPDDDYISWFIGAIYLDNPETIYFATVSDEGSEFHINGRLIHSWPGIHTRKDGATGKRGASVSLKAGLHRIDYYHFEATGPQEAQLTWRRKDMPADEVPELVTGFARSGLGSIDSIELVDGRRSAVVNNQNKSVGYIWLGKQPMNLFVLTASALAASDNLTATWELGKERRLESPVLEWLAPGDPDHLSHPVTLAISNTIGVARTTARMTCPWTPPQLSLDSSGDRLNLRKALYNMLRATPPQRDPCADWTPDHWELLAETIEPYRAGAIVLEIFNRSNDTVYKRPPEQRWLFEERLIEYVRLQRNDKLLLDWIDRFEKQERDRARKFRWRDERFCAQLFDINNIEAAHKELARLRDGAITPDQTQIIALRQGDLARAQGDVEAATGFYKDAQERYRARNKTGMAGGRLAFAKPAPKSKEEATADSRRRRTQSLTARRKVDDWKIYTVHDASHFATINSLLAQDAIAEALQRLSDWENESPQSKLTGEYPLAEARVYAYLEDYRRAINTLAAYRKCVTMTAQLADVMKFEAECRLKIRDTKAVAEIVEEFLKRFPGHPYESEMKEML